ncbi:MAG: rod shape-determining protein MreD [Hydrogenoanaerobacterium sp.]
MTKNTHIYVLKYTSFVALFIFLYVLQNTPMLFSINGVKPNLVVPAAVCLAMFEGEFTGGIMGAFAGLLCDLASFTIFGFNGILVMAGCVAAGLLTAYLTQLRISNALMLGFIVLLLRGLLEYFFYFQMWGFENRSRVLLFSILPSVLYSTAVIVPIYYIVRWLTGYFAGRLRV